jgi:hypothetical protein
MGCIRLQNEPKNKPKAQAMELSSIEDGNEMMKSGKIETFMIVTDRKQIDLLPKSKQAKVGYYVITQDSSASFPIGKHQELDVAA